MLSAEKTTPYGEIFKILCRKFSQPHRSTLLCSNVVKFCWREITKQKFGLLSNCRYCADRAQNLPGPATNIWLTMFQISSKSVHFRRSYSRTGEGRSFGPYSKSMIPEKAFGRIIIIITIIIMAPKTSTYRQYCVFVDDNYAKYTDTDWLSTKTMQKYVHLTRTFRQNAVEIVFCD